MFSKGLAERERDHYERQLALLQEQLADARQEARDHRERADAAVDEIVKQRGLPAISAQSKRDAAGRAERTAALAEKAVVRADLMFEEVPFGDPRGRYAKPEDASLDNDEIEVPLPPLAHFLGTRN